MLKPYNRAELMFDLIREIGQDGKNSQAFVARDHQLDAEIVIKRIVKANIQNAGEFFAESKALHASAHPNVVPIHYACEDVDHVYLALPFYARGAVNRLITGQHMTVREIVTIGCQVLSGLHNIHSKGLIHFDIKPDNVLLSNRGEALLSDFGLAKQMTLGVAIPNKFYTPMVPPELWAQQGFGPTFDIYQFGLTLYRMCKGNEAFYAQLQAYGAPPNFNAAQFSADVIAGRFPNRNAFPPHIPAKLRNVVKTCLRVDPAQRFQSALEASNALAQVDGETLDWRFTQTPDMFTWTKNKNGTISTLTVEANGRSTCTRQVNNGAPRRVMAMCKPAVTPREIARFLGEN